MKKIAGTKMRYETDVSNDQPWIFNHRWKKLKY